MASTTVGIAPPSSPKALLVGYGDAQQSNMTTSDNNDSTMHTKLAPINPLLLAPACFGSSGAMSFLFNRENSNAPPMATPTQPFLDLLDTPGTRIKRGLMVQQAPHDIEDGVDQPALPAAARLLKGVTAEGDTALHVVASHGDSAEFLKCASIINGRDQDILLAVNKKGDTPLHCAARAGKSKMVSWLIELAEYRSSA
ncbi:hypothetical protein ZWY2020_055026 [Hordeum vulgare]|nr:hypothetical protein ZWY2020_055026 [Hordeum vulgare]